MKKVRRPLDEFAGKCEANEDRIEREWTLKATAFINCVNAPKHLQKVLAKGFAASLGRRESSASRCMKSTPCPGGEMYGLHVNLPFTV